MDSPEDRTSYGWVVVMAAFTLTFIGFGAAYTFAAFFKAFQAEFGAARGDVSLAFSLAGFLWFTCGAPAGMLADRYGAKRVTLAGAACLALALWLAGTVNSLQALYAAYSIGMGVGVGLVYVPSVGAVAPWFDKNRAAATGIAVAGIGAGTLVMPLLAAWLIKLLGWRQAYTALALVVLTLGLCAACAIRNPDAHGKGQQLAGMSLGGALRGTEFWLLYASILFTAVGAFIPMVHLTPYARDMGNSEAQAVGLVSLVGIGSLLGRFLIGPVADRMGRRTALVSAIAAMSLLLLLWSTARSYWTLVIFATAFGMSYGGWVGVLPTIIMDVYGPRAVSAIIGSLYTAAGIGTLLGPWLAGTAYDALSTYAVPILVSSALVLAGALCVVVIELRTRSRRFSHGTSS